MVKSLLSLKNFAQLIVLLVMTSSIISGCGTSNFSVEGKVNVVTSFYPLYDFSQKIGGEFVHVINLVPTGVEPHDWTPKVKDMKNISNADVFVYNGADFEGWVDNFLDGLNKDHSFIVVEASKGANLINTNDEADNEHEHEHEHGNFDPHIWLSPKQAKVMAENIKDAFVSIDPSHAEAYTINYQRLIDSLNELDEKLDKIVEAAPKKEIVVSHEAFGYIARDYGIRQVAVMGLSPEAEPTVQKMREIKIFAEEHQIKYILFEELVSSKLAETLANSLGIDTLVLNPLEGLTEKQQKAGEDYFSLMESNLTTIEKALQ